MTDTIIVLKCCLQEVRLEQCLVCQYPDFAASGGDGSLYFTSLVSILPACF